VSGSGKSSIVFDTVAVEARRQLGDTFSWFIRNQLPSYERPDADAIENLTTPVVVDQQPVSGNARSTVGTITDIYGVVRALFARHAEPTTGLVATYSFNNTQGMCPECDGLGRAVHADLDRLLDRTKSLDGGAILFPPWKKIGSPEWQQYGNSPNLDPTKALQDYSAEEWETFLHGRGWKVELSTQKFTYQADYEGFEDRFARSYLKRDLSSLSEKTRETVQRFVTDGVCPACNGDRLNPTALASRIDGRNIADWSRMQVSDLIELLTHDRRPGGDSDRRRGPGSHSSGWQRSGSATSASTGPPRRCPAARGSG